MPGSIFEMKRPTLVLAAAIAATLSLPAMAQTVGKAPATAATAPQGVNPFLGTPLNFESAKQDLELAKVRSQLLDEQVKQRAAEIDLKQLPSKREAELRKTLYGASSMTPPPDLPAIQLDGSMKAPAKKAASKKNAAKPVDVAPAAPVVPPAPRVEVLGLTDSADGRSAMISINGNVASVKSGDMTPVGRVQLNGDQVVVGGRNYAMHSATLSRLTVPSTAPAAGAPGAPGGAPAGGAFPGALGGVADVLRNAGPATSKGPLPPGLAPIVR